MTATRGDSPRIALVVDNPYRDLPGMVLVAGRLCELGAICYLVPMNLEWLETTALAPDFALLTNLRGPKQAFARGLMDAGIGVGVLDSEGGVFPDLGTYGRMAAPTPDVYGGVSCFCSWGPRLAEYLRRCGAYRDDQLSVTGAPRFDYYARRWRRAALRMSRDLDRYARPIVLVNGSFPRANPAFHTPEQEIESWAPLGFDREYMLRYQRVEAQAVRDLASIANHLADRFPEATVVYRPHPFERLATYERLLDRRGNLHLLKVGTVDGWILRASVVVHRNSTTAVEGAFAGVPVLLPSWVNVGERFEAVESVSVSCGSPEELDDQVSRCLNGVPPRPDGFDASVARTVGDWFSVNDGEAHARVAAVIFPKAQGLDDFDRRREVCRKNHYAWRWAVRSRASRAGSMIRKGLGLPAAWSFRHLGERDPGAGWAASEKRFDEHGVRGLVDALDGEFRPWTVERATEGRDYLFGYRGHAVVCRPAPEAVP